MWEDYFVNFALGILLTTIKNPERVAKFRRALIKLRDALIALQLGGTITVTSGIGGLDDVAGSGTAYATAAWKDREPRLGKTKCLLTNCWEVKNFCAHS